MVCTIRADLLSGLVPALALILRAIAFSIAVISTFTGRRGGRAAGAQVAVIGMNTASEPIVDELALHGKSGAADPLALRGRGAKGWPTKGTAGGVLPAICVQPAGIVNFPLKRPCQALDKDR